jgi:hypothetical protein
MAEEDNTSDMDSGDVDGDEREQETAPPDGSAAACARLCLERAKVKNDSVSGNGSNSNNKDSLLHGDSTYSAIYYERVSRYSINYLHGDGVSDCNPNIGTFFSPADHRILKATVKSYFLLLALIPAVLVAKIALEVPTPFLIPIKMPLAMFLFSRTNASRRCYRRWTPVDASTFCELKMGP